MTDSDDRVSVVVVSHSRALAEAAVALASEMVHGEPLTIEVAAGTDDGGLGTDAMAIKEAIERADGPAGTVVLMDLGSAILSTELALEMLDDPGLGGRVTLTSAPIVEGLVVAVVTAAGGADRAEVADEARNALRGKSTQLGEDAAQVAAPARQPGGAAGRTAVFTVQNPHGLHARPAARLVGEIRGLDADVELRNVSTEGPYVPGRSLSRVATLGALSGHDVEVRATGADAEEAVDRIVALAAERFGEDAETLTDVPLVDTAGPLAASPGVAIGRARRLRALSPADVPPQPVGTPDEERRRLVGAVERVRGEIEDAREATRRSGGAEGAAIFEAHLLLLEDDDVLGTVDDAIAAGASASDAWGSAIDEVQGAWEALADDYLRGRAADVRAVGDQVLDALRGASSRTLTDAGILVADDLTPADTAKLDIALVRGILLAHGSPSSHAAILARARGIPVVASAGQAAQAVVEGDLLVLDGSTGEFAVNPSDDVLGTFRSRAERERETRLDDLAQASDWAFSTDGERVVVSANLGSVPDGEAALASGADAAGLVRTEFLFLGRDAAPDAAEQRAEYAAIAAAIGGRRITLRTLDVGGDKPLGYVPVRDEANPFLGVRGVRLSLLHRDLLRAQLDAIVRTASDTPVHVMVPMVSLPDELVAVRELLDEVAGADGIPSGLHVGMMVEVPSAALKIEAFLPHLDFVSIGTNDLTQYVMAAERGNAAVASLSDALDPGVLRLVDHVCRAAAGRIDVAVCGEAASDPSAVPLLVGLGVRELSVSPPAVPRTKALVRTLDTERCVTLAAEALTAGSASDVRRLVSKELL